MSINNDEACTLVCKMADRPLSKQHTKKQVALIGKFIRQGYRAQL